MSKQEKNIIKIEDRSDIQNVFTDIIQVHVSRETVSIKVAIRDTDNLTAKSSHNIIMTLPHFLRFAEVCNNSAQKILEEIKQIDVQHDN